MSARHICTRQQAGQNPREPPGDCGAWRLVAVVDAGIQQFVNKNAWGEEEDAPAVYLYWELKE